MTDDTPTPTDGPPHEEDPAPTDFIAATVLKLGHAFSLLFLISMAILIFEVIMRYVFDRPTIWVHETTIFLCAICFVFGGLHSVSRDGHIRIVLLYDHVSAQVRRWLDIAIYTVCGLATAMFSVSIWPTVVDSLYAPTGEFRIVTSGSAWNPPFPTFLRIFLFVVLVVMTLQFLIFVINRIRNK